MKRLKQLTFSVALVLVLTASVFAGIISTPEPPPPPLTPSSAANPGEIWIPGEIQSEVANESAMADGLLFLKALMLVF
jgi:hypothetical protein